MSIIRNIRLKSIEGRRYIDPEKGKPKQIRIDHNSTIASMSLTENKNQASIEFQYTASYGAVGMIKLEGNLIYESNNIEKIFKEWSENRKMPDEDASRIHTAIMHACVPEAVTIAKDLFLPPPIPLPQVQLGKIRHKAGSDEGLEIA
ncbi:hypothetical protein B6U70_00435 [Euryarchaeota archaeon ex4484_162]|nr:hypothetical protein [Thermoplasmata archaeon]OYT58459.1 MAG: hypothetical protein B6U70_00435 [Euryarchaeota archaeon ex4484_162]RLF30624.1 MAG: hypothetical protein DRJ99_01995 [Thermoplasmata archaeon]RLF62457.1 MAG: hypothetical protein DRN16_01510 [Thermoplasmata archaeon]HDM25289.1 hypothetical protein [Thermoplasmatales archaeon]